MQWLGRLTNPSIHQSRDAPSLESAKPIIWRLGNPSNGQHHIRLAGVWSSAAVGEQQWKFIMHLMGILDGRCPLKKHLPYGIVLFEGQPQQLNRRINCGFIRRLGNYSIRTHPCRLAEVWAICQCPAALFAFYLHTFIFFFAFSVGFCCQKSHYSRRGCSWLS